MEAGISEVKRQEGESGSIRCHRWARHLGPGELAFGSGSGKSWKLIVLK